jgi:phospholipase C
MPVALAARPIALHSPAVSASLAHLGRSCALLIVVLAVAVAQDGYGSNARSHAVIDPGIHHIRHVVMIMQENRSFDSYFGTYPGADGYPMKHGRPAVCVPDPLLHRCVRPFHDRQARNEGGPHGPQNALGDINGGRMDGFVREAIAAKFALARGARLKRRIEGCRAHGALGPRCELGKPVDVMGYHDGSDLPNYWAYARRYVLQDHMFEPNYGWSLPAHLFQLSAWSAKCARPSDPATCRNDLSDPPEGPASLRKRYPSGPLYAWTDLTYLLHRNGVSWGYYLVPGKQPDCDDGGDIACKPGALRAGTPSSWNPLPSFTTVRRDGQLGNIQPVSRFVRAAKNGRLPAVTWIVPDFRHSEHPGSLLGRGQAWVTHLVNTVMRGPEWKSTAVFIAWDDWGGFYDHVVPPNVDRNGYGLRVPALVLSPYAKRDYVDHQTLSFDAYLRFIEDDFLGGARLDPRTDGRPDPRPTVRETVPQLGDLSKDFDFAHHPHAKPLLLRPFPRQ